MQAKFNLYLSARGSIYPAAGAQAAVVLCRMQKAAESKTFSLDIGTVSYYNPLA